MALAIQVDGLAAISVDTGIANAMEVLGYTRNGAEITLEDFWLDVPGDEHGGDDGPPIDVQELGEIARVRLELTKYDTLVADKIKARLLGGTAGVKQTSGKLVFANSYSYRLLVNSATQRPYNFLVAIPRMPWEENKGTKFSTLIFEFECHKTNADAEPANTLYNASID